MTTFEYTTDLIPFAPGPEGMTTAYFQNKALDGWRVASVIPVPIMQGSPLDVTGQPRQSLLLFVILERPKE